MGNFCDSVLQGNQKKERRVCILFVQQKMLKFKPYNTGN